MEIPKYVLEIAVQKARNGTPLPALISESADFWVADEGDEKVIAFAGFEEGGKKYKVGVFKL